MWTWINLKKHYGEWQKQMAIEYMQYYIFYKVKNMSNSTTYYL